MKIQIHLIYGVMTLLLHINSAYSQAAVQQKPLSTPEIETAKITLKESAGKIWFQENKGQLPPEVLYSFSTNFGAVFVEKNAIIFNALKIHETPSDKTTELSDSDYIENQRIRLTFEGANSNFNIRPINPIVRNINYFTSANQSDFVYNVKAYSELYFTDVYPGIDLRMYSVAKGQLEFDWILKKGSDYSKIRMRAEGQDGIDIQDNGGFTFKCRFEDLVFNVPESYQVENNKKELKRLNYTLEGNVLKFSTTDYINPEIPLVIDPTVFWANYMDASGNDYLFASESDNCGRVYLAGRSKAAATSSYIQGATGYDVSFNTGDNAILYIFSADGDSIKAFTYFGSNITPADLDLFPNGRVIVAGSMRNKSGATGGSIPATASGTVGGRPTYASYSTSASLSGKGWLAIFDSELQHLYYSSHMPGTSGLFGSFDEKGVTCLEVVDDNTYYVAGITDIDVRTGTGTTFVNNTSTPDNTQNRGEAYISRFSGSSYNTWDWGTYVGGNDDEIFFSIKLSSDKTKLAFAGNFIDDNVTSGAGFPTRVNPVDNTSSNSEGFVGWLTNQSTNPANFGMLSFIGGADEEGDLLVESMQQYIYVLGYTNSSSFPGTSVSGFTPYQSTIKGTAGTYDAFVSRIPFNGSSAPAGVFRSTYFGGGGTELSGGVIFNTNDSNLYLFITTGSASVGQVGAATGYPTVNTDPPSNFYDANHDQSAHTNWTPQTNSGIGSNADISFVTLSPDLTKNLYTSYCGGSDRDYLGNTGRLNGAGHYGFNEKTNIYSLGTTIHSNDLAARGSFVFNNQSFFDTTSTGGDDHFIVKFNLSNTDMGDAPRSYDGGNPARHGTSSLGLNVAKFGAALTDYDSKPESSVQADGDDNRNTGPALCKSLLDDEDGLIAPLPIITVETTGNVNIPVYINNAIGSNANVYAWIDLDGDGQFESGESANAQTASSNLSLTAVSFTNSGTTITATKAAHGLTVGSYIGIEGSEGNQEPLNGIWQVTAVPSTSTFQFVVTTTPPGALGSVTNTVQKLSRTNLVFNLGTGKACPNEIKGGRTYLRMRITTSTLTDTVATTNLDERSHGVAPNGEVEDHVVYIRGRDYGDLPSSYGTASVMVFGDINANNIPDDTGAVWLGSTVDIEKDCAANLSANADGDDLENDDEDGFVFPTGLIKANSNYNFSLNLSRSTSGTRIHYGVWFDWNGDGDFTDASDGFYSGNSTSTSATIAVTTPSGSNYSPNFAARVMVGRAAFTASNYNLVFTNGEIEDYINDPGILIRGQIFNDGDGTYDALIDANPGVNTGSPSGTRLWAYLINPAGSTIVDSVAVQDNGNYTLQGANASTSGYEVRISTTRAAIGAAPIAVTLPTNWVSVGEQYGTSNGAGAGIEALTPASNSRVAVNTGTVNITNVNFGIDFRPQSFDTTAATQSNPPGSTQYPVIGLRGYDREQGMFFGSQQKTIIIESLPSNATLYYDSDGAGGNPPVAVTLGQVINNYVASNLLVDPSFTGVGNVTFTYAWRDSAQAKDLSPATVTLPFGDPSITISGTVFDDGDGNLDGAIDGTAIGTADGNQLYVYLDSAGIIVRKVTLSGTGTYSFTGNPSQTYTVIATSANLSIGATAPTSSVLPTNWLNTGEQFGTNNTSGSGIETGTANGVISVNSNLNVTNVNFGIEKRPESNNVTATAQTNPGGTVQVQVPALSGSDLEDGTLPNNTTPSRTVVVETLPSNATLYYNGVAVTVGQVIANYNSSLLTVDPNFNGAGTVTFTYAWRDSAQAKDLSPATVTMPFDALTISGTVYHDPDGLTDSDVDGQGQGSFTGSQLTAYLVDGSNTIIGANTVASNGTYSFSNANSNSTFTVIVTTQSFTVGSAAPSSSVLPTNFVHVGEDYGVNNNAGSGIVGGTPNGIITVSTTTSNVSNVDFGIEYGTHAHDKIYQITPDSIYLRTGAPSGFTHYIHLNRAAGTADTNVNSTNTAVMPGLLSGFDLEEGRYEGSTGIDSGTIVFTTLPDTNNALLMYNGIRLRPNPTVSDPSWIYWNSSTSRYEIPNFQANKIILLFKMAYQTNTSFNYAFIDSAGITGRIGTYALNYTVPLPIDLSDLSCASGNGGITLQWSAYNVSELQSMHVLRSTDGVTFSRIASFNQFNRNQNVQSFRYVDIQTEAAQQIYKIEAHDLHGVVSFTNPCFNANQGAVEAVKISGVPNPTEGLINVNIQTPIDQNFGIRIQDASGRLLLEKSVDVSQNMDLPFDLSNYAPGIYNIVVNWEGRSEVIRIVRL